MTKKGEKMRVRSDDGGREPKPVNPAKTDAWFAVDLLIRKGEIKPAKEQSCVRCGVFPAKYLHHPNGYESPHDVEVIALCATCHGVVHKDKNKE